MTTISLTVNGTRHTVGSEISSDVTLLDYLRNYLELRGTKYMCREGGCGACIVSVVKSPGAAPTSVNACLVSVTSCHEWEITTVEKVGNRKDGYHPLQTTLAEAHGTQCGYCTPGWIMSMYSLISSKPNITQKELENSFGSNICRCTGYRPILDAFKKFASDAKKSIKMPDIEDLKICKKSGITCKKTNCDEDEWCLLQNEIIHIELKDGRDWYRVVHLSDVFDIIRDKTLDSYMLVAGNTAKGVFPIEEYPITMVDISGVSELKGSEFDQNLVVGAGSTLTELLEIFETRSSEEHFTYLKVLYDHLDLIAHIPVRNLGSIAGNLMIKHHNNAFPSDLFLILETVGAELTIVSGTRTADRQRVNMQQFLNVDMTGKVLYNVLFPPLNNSQYKVVTYKIMPRFQSTHAVINAGFLYRINPNNNNTVLEARLVYGGLINTYVRASTTEWFLLSKPLFTNETLQSAIAVLEQELVAVENPPEPSPAYRKQLAISLFYKGLLSLCPTDTLHTRYRSGGTKIHETRPVSSGVQVYETTPSVWPLTQTLQKAEALIQCSAEAPYTDDLPHYPYEVFASFVLSTEGTGTITNIDASEALRIPGVLAFYTAQDIPGVNSYTPGDLIFYTGNEEVLCSGNIKYFNEPIGIIVAESRYLADKAAKLVHVTYTNVRRPVIDIKEAINNTSRVTQYAEIDATESGNENTKTISGDFTVYHQYHFSMETLVCVSCPSEQGLEVHSSTQWMDGTQIMIARALNMDLNSVDLYVRRLGGAFGIKISRSTQQAVAASLVAKLLNRPCRFVQSLNTNMRSVGKRFPATGKFQAHTNDAGIIQNMDYTLYLDNGYMVNEWIYALSLDVISNCYRSARWTIKGNNVITDTAKNTWCRSPGTLEAISMIEHIMEQISYETAVDPVQLRLAHIDTDQFGELLEMYETIKEKSNYDERRAYVHQFNAENRWKKRGLRTTFMKWAPTGGPRFNVVLSVYHADGTVNITHSGVEMGQGINTKAIQIASYFLKIPVEKIKIKGNNTIVGPNAFITGGSVAIQNVGIAVQRACENLLENIKPTRELMPDANWETLVQAAFDADVSLQATGFVNSGDEVAYNCCGICFAEVEVDILTGETEILRVDLIEDPGRSINPEIDVGQIEGAFIMGMGYWTCEHIELDDSNGEVLTNRSWNYHVPQARDIPQDFRVYLTNKYYASETILGAKAIGEPAICLAPVIPFAIREAIVSARMETGIASNTWFPIDGPFTLEKIHTASSTRHEDFKYY